MLHVGYITYVRGLLVCGGNRVVCKCVCVCDVVKSGSVWAGGEADCTFLNL